MVVHSCGGVLYTIKQNKVYIVLGKEGTGYFHFKGRIEKNENFQEAAIREIYEETRKVVKIKNIKLEYNDLKTKKKHYHLGLIFVKNDIVSLFDEEKKKMDKEKNIDNKKYEEKKDIKLFELSKIFTYNFHKITLCPILYFYNKLNLIQNILNAKKKIFKIKNFYNLNNRIFVNCHLMKIIENYKHYKINNNAIIIK